MKFCKKFGGFALVALLAVSTPAQVLAQQSQSGNYSVDQAYFGTGGELEMTSDQYKASAGVGDSAAGAVEGIQWTGQAGSPTSAEPLLEFAVGGGGNDHGVLDPDQTVFGTATIQIRSYNGSGYIVQVTGMPPTQTVHTIPGLPTPSTAQTNVEQFGINLVDNDSPNVGTDPEQIPANEFSYGIPAPDYSVKDLFKYVSGDIVAQSTQASGETKYTMSYILNVNNLTPAGQYKAELSVVVSAKF